MNLSPANPSMTLARHMCPSAALAAARKRRASNADPSEQLQQQEEEEVDCIGQPQQKKHKQSIPEFAVTAAQQLQIIEPVKPDFVRNFRLCKAAKQFPLLSVAANKLLSAHATSAAAERNWSAWGRTYSPLRNSLSIETAEKMVHVKANMPTAWYS